jgi:competence protein ComEA
MSDVHPELPRPSLPPTWRERLAALTDDLGLTGGRLVTGVVGLVLVGGVAWRIRAPAPAPPEMRLPFAEASPGSTVAPGGTDTPGAPGTPADPDATGTGAAGATAAGLAGTATSTSLPSELVVHVAGAVAAPGVQRLPPGARVVDALDAAGGAATDADLARLNLAAPLADGQMVYVLRLGEEAPPAIAGPVAPSTGAAVSTPSAGVAPVDVNTASAEQLDTLPGIGPSTAAAIIAHREEHGPFTSVEQLLDVRGIGEAKLSQMRDLVVTSG